MFTSARQRWQAAYRLHRATRHSHAYPCNSTLLEALEHLVGSRIAWHCTAHHDHDPLTTPLAQRFHLWKTFGIHWSPHLRGLRTRKAVKVLIARTSPSVFTANVPTN